MLNNELDNYNENTFNSIKHIDEYGNEYWTARELQNALEYTEWRNFEKVIEKAMISANNSKNSGEVWLVDLNKPITTGKGTDINKISNEYINKIEEWMNNYLRKLFGYKSSNMLLLEI